MHLENCFVFVVQGSKIQKTAKHSMREFPGCLYFCGMGWDYMVGNNT